MDKIHILGFTTSTIVLNFIVQSRLDFAMGAVILMAIWWNHG